MAYQQKLMMNSIESTRVAYAQVLKLDCSAPCNRINPHDGSGIDARHNACLSNYKLCDVCGMDDESKFEMVSCACCQQHGQHTEACTTCIPWSKLQWLVADKTNHHWRCTRCRWERTLNPSSIMTA